MLGFVKNKIFSKKWMMISLLIGNILLISIAACSPMYSDAVLQRMLTKNLANMMEKNQNPGLIKIRSSYKASKKNDEAERTEKLTEEFLQKCMVPITENVTVYYKPTENAVHEVNGKSVDIHIEAPENLEEHITMVIGEMPKACPEELLLEAVVSENTLKRSDLFVGEVLTLNKIVNEETGEACKVVITGVFAPSSEEDLYWVQNPNRVRNYLYVNQEDFVKKFIEEPAVKQTVERLDYITMDYQQIKGKQVEELIAIFKDYIAQLDKHHFEVTAYSTLNSYLTNAAKLNVTLIVLQLPIFLLLASFIFMVSGQMLSMEQNEISVIKSRGASKKQVLIIYLVQSMMIALVSFLLALPLAYLLCQVLGSANSFLEFVSRKFLPAKFGLPVWLFGSGAAVISIMTMVLPVIRYAKVGIVDHKRNQMKQRKPMWQKLFLDIICIGISLYGLYSYNNQYFSLMSQMRSGAALDPVLYLCSEVFILGCALFVVRIFPLLVKAFFSVFKRHLSPAMYASFLQILRNRGNRNFIMIFLILTMSFGIFSAKTAHTINSNGEDELQYKIGADMVIEEKWKMTVDSKTGNAAADEPDFTKYGEIEEDAVYTKVMRRTNVSINTQRNVDAVLLGIETKGFGEVAIMKEGLLQNHWYHYLNSLSKEAQGVVVSTSFRDELGYKLGEKIYYGYGDEQLATGFICGFVDFWPSIESTFSGDNGVSYFIVANLAYLETVWGTLPYEIWLRNLYDSSQYMYEFSEEHGIVYDKFLDVNAELVEMKNEPELQATNGVLTVGFIVILTLCSVGFLIYWILSIQSRALQFGIFRAMGMTMKEVLSMLFNEQIFVSGVSIVAGIGIGKLASQLFVPMIQMVYNSGKQLLPAEIQNATDDTLKMYIVVAVVMLLCFGILGWLIKKIKIAEALKLGED